MAGQGAKTRAAWSDRFRRPEERELLDALPRQLVPAFEHARAAFVQNDGAREVIEWRGVWHWTFAYRTNGENDPAWAYLVPDPVRPRVCVPFPDELLLDLPSKRVAKVIREALVHAPSVSGIRWPTWDIQSKGQVDEVLVLAQLKSDALDPKPR